MVVVHVTRQEFLKDRQGKRLSDVLDDPEQPFDALLAFFNREEPQRRMEDSETYDKKRLWRRSSETWRPCLMFRPSSPPETRNGRSGSSRRSRLSCG